MHILFLCVANSARSQMAEGLAREMLGKGVEVASAGSNPTGVNSCAVEVMREIGIDISQQRSKAIDEFDLDTFDVIVTLCADEVCPLVPGNVRKQHWPIEDPVPGAAATDPDSIRSRFRHARDEIRHRIETLAVQGS